MRRTIDSSTREYSTRPRPSICARSGSFSPREYSGISRNSFQRQHLSLRAVDRYYWAPQRGARRHLRAVYISKVFSSIRDRQPPFPVGSCLPFCQGPRSANRLAKLDAFSPRSIITGWRQLARFAWQNLSFWKLQARSKLRSRVSQTSYSENWSIFLGARFIPVETLSVNCFAYTNLRRRSESLRGFRGTAGRVKSGIDEHC